MQRRLLAKAELRLILIGFAVIGAVGVAKAIFPQIDPTSPIVRVILSISFFAWGLIGWVYIKYREAPGPLFITFHGVRAVIFGVMVMAGNWLLALSLLYEASQGR